MFNKLLSGKNKSSSESIVVEAPERPEGSPISNVKHIIAVGSGKGGVGKSTVAVNLAIACSKLGAKVGLVDADVYGPSIPRLMGATENPKQIDGKIIPTEAHGIKIMSMGILGGDTPVVWRGPMASRAVNQFIGSVAWGDLDYLFVDLPPGTGDIHITLSQSARLSGAVVVMTPQALATEVAIKGLKMFQQVRVPIIGIVENMAGFLCKYCNHESKIFKKGGGEKIAKELDLPLLGSIPISEKIVECSDSGTPLIVESEKSKESKIYFDLAMTMVAELRKMLSGERVQKAQVVNMEPNYKANMFKVIWNDNKQSLVSFQELRYLCPCAHCVDEGTGDRIIKKEQVAENVQPTKVQTVGNYAISVHWSDGHHTGIYSYDNLRKLLVKE